VGKKWPLCKFNAALKTQSRFATLMVCVFYFQTSFAAATTVTPTDPPPSGPTPIRPAPPPPAYGNVVPPAYGNVVPPAHGDVVIDIPNSMANIV
jgi:hypothetical protein